MRAGLLGVAASVVLIGQTAPARPEFEVASIKASPPGAINTVNVGIHIDGSQVRCGSLSIKDYLGIAYRLKNYQISGPEWIASERFDINARLPAGSVGKEIPEMLQALFEQRFQMKTHGESKDLPVYGLIVGKSGVKMQEAPPDPPSENPGGGVNVSASGQANGVNINYGNGSSFAFGNNRLEGRKLSATLLADTLARFADRPVIDLTKLTANYDFVLEFTPEDYRAMMIRSAIAAGVTLPPQALQLAEAASLDSLFNAVEKLGLKLEARKAPVDTLVIDRMEKTPTEN
ncbi:MAG: TIGR03435 family protein [Acidobacteriia bacterium]|nr:TIGR03435 family protein [Terriglobia bacterium]